MGSDLVAKLGVDATAWDAGFKKAASTAKSFASGFGPMLAPLAAGIAGVWGASESIGAYKGSLEAQRKLSAVIEATGGAAGLTTDQITEFAAEMQTLTNFEDDATTAAASALAAFTNIRGQTFTDTIESAMDLSTVMGGDLQSNVKLLGKALNNPAESFGKLAKAGVTFTDAQKEQIVTMQKAGDLVGAQEVLLGGLQDKFGGAAMAVKDPWTQLQNTMGDVAENIGSVLLPSVNVLTNGVISLLGPIADAGDYFKDFGIEVAVVLENIGGILLLGIEQWKLFFVQIGLEAAYTFTDVIPAYIGWLADNWMNIFQTLGANTLTLFENLGKNLRAVWNAVLNFFRTGTFKVNFSSITEGFVNTIEKLPDIPPRAITDLERGLQSNIDSATEALGESMNASRERMTKEFDTSSKVPSGTLVDEASADVKGGKHDKKNQAASAFSKEAVEIAFAGTGPNKLEDLATKQLEATKETNKLLADQSNSEDEGADI